MHASVANSVLDQLAFMIELERKERRRPQRLCQRRLCCLLLIVVAGLGMNLDSSDSDEVRIAAPEAAVPSIADKPRQVRRSRLQLGDGEAVTRSCSAPVF